MKSRSMVCADVAQSDEFLGMSLESQLLYFLILFSADVCGRIYGPARITRGFGFDADSLQELYDNGFLLSVDGLAVDAHCWRNNKLDGRLKARMDTWDAFTEGRIGFDGEPFKSSYRLIDGVTTEQRRNGDVTTTPNINATQPQDQLNTKSNLKPTEHHSQPQVQKQCAVASNASDEKTGKEGTEDKGAPCMCRRCNDPNALARYYTEGGRTFITCKICGTYEFEQAKSTGQSWQLTECL